MTTNQTTAKQLASQLEAALSNAGEHQHSIVVSRRLLVRVAAHLRLVDAVEKQPAMEQKQPDNAYG